MELKIGIVGQSEGWKQLLLQEGVPCSVATDSFFSLDYSVVVASDDVNDRESEMLRRYLILGGAVLCSAKVYERIRQTTSQFVTIEYLYPSHNSEFRALGIIDVRARCQLAWNANELLTNRGSLAAHVGMYGHGHVIALPFNPAELIRDHHSSVKSFYSPEQRLPFEKVSLISKGEIRLLVSRCLELLHHRRGLPYAHLWYYPNGSRSLFNFRIDTDSGTEEQIKELYLQVHRNRLPATWFIDAKSQENIMNVFKDMEEQEFGVHCFEHRTYPTYEQNIQNIQAAKVIVQRNGLEPRGFAGPFGHWNVQLGRAIVDCGFEYSSEFSYDYDTMPSVPSLPIGEGALQVPVHPICIGNLKRHSYSEEQMMKYFDGLIQRKLLRREPLFFYHHPRDGHLGVLEQLFQKMSSEHVSALTMLDYARWWKMRTGLVPKVEYSEQGLHVTSGRFDTSVHLHITKPDGVETFIPLADQIVFDTVQWNLKPAVWKMPDDYTRMRRFNYRVPLIRALDAVTDIFSRKQL